MTEGIRARMSTDPTKYTVLGTEDGPCYLKAVLNKLYVETNSTNYYLRQKPFRLQLWNSTTTSSISMITSGRLCRISLWVDKCLMIYLTTYSTPIER
jgi:hypothetical protein